MPGSFGVELLSAARPDYVCVDQQHGLADLGALVPMLAATEAAGATPRVRVPRNDPADIGKVLDAGARGIIVPLVNDASEAACAARACRYPPEGGRSYGPVRASVVLGTRDPAELGREVSCIVMVETREGLNNVEEIAATQGVDGVYVGPTDLALSLGLPPTLDVVEPAHAEAVARIKDACKRHGIATGIHTASAETAKKHADAGFEHDHRRHGRHAPGRSCSRAAGRGPRRVRPRPSLATGADTHTVRRGRYRVASSVAG